MRNDISYYVSTITTSNEITLKSNKNGLENLAFNSIIMVSKFSMTSGHVVAKGLTLI